jgi:3',5'-cyclic AMP phosphodiesterase CpdA
MTRIVVLSDIHLSPTHGFFWQNWCVARDFANASKAEAVIINGDLAINGPDSDAEIAFAASALKGLRGPVFSLPGNHDVGDEPPGQDPNQIIDAGRLDRWDRSFRTDRWALDAGGWRLVGVNAQLFGSGLTRERAQERWLEEQLVAAGGSPIALFLHKPIFLETPHDDVPTTACIAPSARRRLLDMLHMSGTCLVVSGHLHQHRDRPFDGVRHLWVPAVAFAAPQALGGDGRCGLTVLDFSRDGVKITVERPDGLVSHDLAALKGHGRYQFLRDMPTSPPPHIDSTGSPT